jgi:glycosyltransferase involved in cell wall biosynthesis
MTEKIIALLGRKDEPTDAIEEYCRYLGAALEAHDFRLDLRRVPWQTHGWGDSLHALKLQAAAWRDTWVLLQYTALAWSVRGFPQRFLHVLKILQSCGARIAVVYHDVEPYAGSRIVDRLRRNAQLRTMRAAQQAAHLAIFTVPIDNVSWRPHRKFAPVFIPVGANFLVSRAPERLRTARTEGPLRIAVFGITGGAAGPREAAKIVDAITIAEARAGAIELSAFGRHADACAEILRNGLRDALVAVHVQGVLPPEQVFEELSSSDVLLFVRGVISSRRGSAIAGIACGLPVIAYEGPETAAPITDAGVVLVPQGNPAALGEALTRVLTDAAFRESLAERSRDAYEKYFSWQAIAARYAEALHKRE